MSAVGAGGDGEFNCQKTEEATVEKEREGDEATLEAVEKDVTPPHGHLVGKGGCKAKEPGEAHDRRHLGVHQQASALRPPLRSCGQGRPVYRQAEEQLDVLVYKHVV